MTNRQEQELDAAEYVIGTLSVVERRAFEDLMASDMQTRRDVWYWERAFGALNVSISPEAPPANMWERIYYSLPAVVEGQKRRPEKPARKKAEVIAAIVPAKKEKKPKREPIAATQVAPQVQEAPQETNGLGAVTDRASGYDKPDPDEYVSHWWRKFAKLATIIALCLGAYLVLRPVVFKEIYVHSGPQNEGNKQFYAVVNADWNLPSIVIRIDSVTGEMKFDGDGIFSPRGKSLQIWHRSVRNGRKSVGLLGGTHSKFRMTPVHAGDVIEISIEPKGGAPEGGPMGPIVYSGKVDDLNP